MLKGRLEGRLLNFEIEIGKLSSLRSFFKISQLDYKEVETRGVAEISLAIL